MQITKKNLKDYFAVVYDFTLIACSAKLRSNFTESFMQVKDIKSWTLSKKKNKPELYQDTDSRYIVPLDREIEASVMIRKQEVITKRGQYKWPKLDDSLGLLDL